MTDQRAADLPRTHGGSAANRALGCAAPNSGADASRRGATWRPRRQVENSGLGALSTEDCSACLLPPLYLVGLVGARAIALDPYLLLYLENLGLRAFLVVYGPRQSMLEGCRAFFALGFPTAVRGAGVHI